MKKRRWRPFTSRISTWSPRLQYAGGFGLTGRAPANVNPSRAGYLAIALLAGAAILILFAFVAFVHIVRWQRTIDYALQRIERDGVMSKGGNWNQLQLSNVPTKADPGALRASAVGYLTIRKLRILLLRRFETSWTSSV